MPRHRGDHDIRRVEIAEAACAVILQTGIEQARLKEIAARLGFTTGVIQHYFNDKEELLLFAKNLLFDRTFARMTAAAAKVSGLERLRALALELLPLTRPQLEMFQLLAAFRGRAIGNPGLMQLQRKRDEIGWKQFADEIRSLQRAGALSRELDANAEAIGLVALVEGLATQLIMGARPIQKAKLTQLVNTYFDKVFVGT